MATRKCTRETPIASLAELSPASKRALVAAYGPKLGDLHERDYGKICAELTDLKERRCIYEASIKSGIRIRIGKNTRLADIPTLSVAAVSLLTDAGYHL